MCEEKFQTNPFGGSLFVLPPGAGAEIVSQPNDARAFGVRKFLFEDKAENALQLLASLS